MKGASAVFLIAILVTTLFLIAETSNIEDPSFTVVDVESLKKNNDGENKEIYQDMSVTATITVDDSTVVETNRLNLGFNLHFYWERELWRTRTVMQQLTTGMNTKMIRVFDYQLSPCSNWDDVTRTGTFDWASTDALINAIINAGATPMIALGFIDSSNIHVPSGMSLTATGLPDPDSFAAYARVWVAHFKNTPVRYYEVFNEAWFYFYPGWVWDNAKAGHFLTLYNASYTAMHAEYNDVLVGNDASLHRLFLDYWIANSGSLDFLSFHKYDSDNIAMDEATPLLRAENRYFVTDTYFYGVEAARTLLGANLPAISSETNWGATSVNGTDPRLQQMVGAAWLALVLKSSILSNVDYILYYAFSSSKTWELANKVSGGFGFGLINQDDNEPWYPYYVNYLVGSHLAVGDDVVSSSSSSTDFSTVAWINSGKVYTLIVCKADKDHVLSFKGLAGTLDYFKLDNAVSYLTPQLQTGYVENVGTLTISGYTVLLLVQRGIIGGGGGGGGMGSTGVLFNDNIAEFEAAFGASFNVTHYSVVLGSAQDATTGWYSKTYSNAAIKMHIDPPTSVKRQTSVGKQTVTNAAGYSFIKLCEYDIIIDGVSRQWLVVSCEPWRVGDSQEYYKSTLVLGEFNV